jgi:hypothetical protein
MPKNTSLHRRLLLCFYGCTAFIVGPVDTAFRDKTVKGKIHLQQKK